MKKLDHVHTSCEEAMPLLSPPIPFEISSIPIQISAYSVITELGHEKERVSPPHPFFTSKGASREVCVKEGRNLMKCVGSTGVTHFLPAHI
tara:strand:- start:141 stop:413 length:273 start_codon:yes stop_codon:yes gene_type:complete